ncbi:MAG: hypothetical protein PVH58_16135, partial [Desulfobacterales bacterium]
ASGTVYLQKISSNPCLILKEFPWLHRTILAGLKVTSTMPCDPTACEIVLLVLAYGMIGG